jgi:hypothetical protein
MRGKIEYVVVWRFLAKNYAWIESESESCCISLFK